jgi:REP element-mobilizing transposase RayT
MTHTRRDVPAAYFLTWTTYGTWLHGDDRGSVVRLGNGATRRVPPRRGCSLREAASLAHPPLILSDPMRGIAEATIREHALTRGWPIHALDVRTNHVHTVVSGNTDPERMMTQFKSWITRRMREAGLVSPERHVWTRHGSTRYLWTPKALAAAVYYVNEMQ